MRKTFAFLVLVAVVAGGCAPRAAVVPAATRPAMATTQPATRPATQRADLTLDQIEPRPVMPAPRATTRPAARPPLDAIELFARARGALQDNQRFTAARLLERAIRLDPDSVELYVELARAAQGADEAIAALEKALALRPDDLELRLQLGRHFFAKGNLPRAIEQFRVATLTGAYRNNGGRAALVSYYLARVLQQAGYDRAALAQYQVLLERLKSRDLAIRSVPELAYLSHRPEGLILEMARLHEGRGEHDQALRAYQMVLKTDPGNAELKARAVRAQLALGQVDDARRGALEVLRQTQASADAVALLNDAYAGGDVAGELRRLHRQDPKDRAVLLALAEVLAGRGQGSEAERLLFGALLGDRGPAAGVDARVVRRLFDLYDKRDDTDGAAKLLVRVTADQPEAVNDVGGLWDELLRPGRKNRLGLPDLQKLDVPASAQAAKQFWVSRIAAIRDRDFLAQSTLQQAVDVRPPFAPAYRALMDQILSREEWDQKQKDEAAQKLIDQAKAAGNPALGDELQGRKEFSAGRFVPAAARFAEAMRQGAESPDLTAAYAVALREGGQRDRSEQVLWKLVGDQPQYEPGWQLLYKHYEDQAAEARALNVLGKWLDQNPTSLNASAIQASVYIGDRRLEEAERLLLKAFYAHPRDPQAINMLHALYAQLGREDELVALLEDYRAKHPANLQVVDHLVQAYVQRKRLGEATRVLDATRQAAGGDPESLYLLAHLYDRVDQKQTTDTVLAEVIRLDPRHAGANNDLGYSWADQGRNLDRAEALIRVAVEIEPENQSFLDSLGWVLYKRGQFAEARQHLLRAVGVGARPDPIVLDHLGDTLYRLGNGAEAVRTWRRSLDRLAELKAPREDLKQLQLQLQTKLKQSERGQPVNVAPVAAEKTDGATQAKN